MKIDKEISIKAAMERYGHILWNERVFLCFPFWVEDKPDGYDLIPFDELPEQLKEMVKDNKKRYPKLYPKSELYPLMPEEEIKNECFPVSKPMHKS